MKKIAIIYHSGYGHTEVLAKEVSAGVQDGGCQPKLIKVEDFSKELDFINAADGIIFGSPTYMGTVSADFKKFMDESSKIWFTSGWKNKLAAGFTNSGSLSGDKLNTLVTMVVFAMQHGMIWLGNDVISKGMEDGDFNRIGSYTGAMAQSNNAPATETPAKGDKETAKYLGKRVAEVAKRFN